MLYLFCIMYYMHNFFGSLRLDVTLLPWLLTKHQQLMGAHMCDCWDILSAQYNKCSHGELGKDFT
jgi:hypothetical protein